MIPGAHISTVCQSEGLGYRHELGDMHGNAAQALFQLSKWRPERNDVLRGGRDAPRHAAAKSDERSAGEHLPGYRPRGRSQALHRP